MNRNFERVIPIWRWQLSRRRREGRAWSYEYLPGFMGWFVVLAYIDLGNEQSTVK